MQWLPKFCLLFVLLVSSKGFGSSIDRELYRKVFEKGKPVIREKCWAHGKTGFYKDIQLTIVVAIAKTGAVKNAQVKSTSKTTKLEQCVAKAVTDFTFPETIEDISITYPMMLQYD